MTPHSRTSLCRHAAAVTIRPTFGRATGLTRIEVLMLVFILGITAGVIILSLVSRPNPANIAAAKAEIRRIETGLQNYAHDNHGYPTTAQGLDALVQKPILSPAPKHWRPYLANLPVDPWGHPYQYQYPGVHGKVDVWSYGPKGPTAGPAGGVIGNWNLNGGNVESSDASGGD